MHKITSILTATFINEKDIKRGKHLLSWTWISNVNLINVIKFIRRFYSSFFFFFLKMEHNRYEYVYLPRAKRIKSLLLQFWRHCINRCCTTSQICNIQMRQVFNSLQDYVNDFSCYNSFYKNEA